MKFLDDLFLNGGETYTNEEIMNHLSQFMSNEDANKCICEAVNNGFINLANDNNGVKVYVR